MIRITAKLFVAVIFTALLRIAPLFAAQPVTYVATNGGGTACTFAQPCASMFEALVGVESGGQVTCFDFTTFTEAEALNSSVTIDCPGVALASTVTTVAVFVLGGANQVVKIRNLTFNGGVGIGNNAILLTGTGTLILENCVFENFSGVSLDIEPTGALNLVITNSRISNNAAGVLIKPAAGGSVTATFDRVTIADNAGGGVKTDTTNGAINLAISNSTITKNGGNGLNAVGGAGGQNVLELIHDVIASNSVAGVQANGTNAGVMVNNTSILNNLTGATSAVGGGRILTYGNNSIVGSLGSGFTGSASLQ